MSDGHLVFSAVYAAATVCGFLVGVLLFRYREKPGAFSLLITAFATVIWSGPLFVTTLVGDYGISAVLWKFTFVGVGITVTGSFVFALEYTGREHLVNRYMLGVLSIEPTIVVVLAFTNPNNLFYQSIGPDSNVPSGIGATYGSAFNVHFLYTFALMALTGLMMMELLYRSKALYRGQAAAIFCGTVFPWVTNMMSLVGSVEGDLTPLGFLFSASLFTVAVVRYRLVDLVPIARNSVLDTVTDGIVVLDNSNRVVDMNPAGSSHLDVEDEQAVVGDDMAAVFDDPKLVEQYTSLTEETTASKAEVASGDRHYETRVRPIEDTRGRHVGWVFVVADITERKERERKLQQQNERLDQFASLVSHDLRNPLTVADGYIDVARQTGDLEHLDEVEQSHERMETIIEDVLALTREGEEVTDPEPVDVGRTAREACEHVDTQGAAVRVRADETIMADRDRLARLLENLYRNSIEHGPETTPEELTITVSTERDDQGDTARILVEDDGVGIPEDRREQVLEHGYTTEEDGTGLGLSIVSQIAEAHGWTTSVGESDGGARFVLDGAEVVRNHAANRIVETSTESGDSVSPRSNL